MRISRYSLVLSLGYAGLALLALFELRIARGTEAAYSAYPLLASILKSIPAPILFLVPIAIACATLAKDIMVPSDTRRRLNHISLAILLGLLVLTVMATCVRQAVSNFAM